MTADPGRDVYLGCVEQLSADPDLLSRLLHEHDADADGWCRAHRVHPQRHPCSIRVLAERATSRSLAPIPHRRPAARERDLS